MKTPELTDEQIAEMSFDEYCTVTTGVNHKGIPRTKYWLEWKSSKTIGWAFSVTFGYNPPHWSTRTRFLYFRFTLFKYHFEITLNWRY